MDMHSLRLRLFRMGYKLSEMESGYIIQHVQYHSLKSGLLSLDQVIQFAA